MVGQVSKVELVELECHGKLVEDLVDNVQELKEDRGKGGVLAGYRQIGAVLELVTHCQPLLLYQDAKTFQCPENL